MNNENLNKTKKEAKEISLTQYFDFLKLEAIFKHCTSFEDTTQSRKFDVFLEENEDGSYNIVPEEAMIPLFEKHTFSETLIVTGISIFEKCCKEWFKWGLKYNPDRLNFFNKKVSINEIMGKDNPEEIIINKTIEDINFKNVQICNEKFKMILGIKIFENRENKYVIERYINHRHVISHNYGTIDFNYVKRTRGTHEDVGKSLILKNSELEEFRNLIYDLITNIASKMIPIVFKNIK
ncbi:hypothetical protein [Methanobacterium sp. ACI-7]|uniref:hypothetical protein n=1 Tax=unclassified Methanobacterium TaxID=2627676 RepID=UPI0039C46B03